MERGKMSKALAWMLALVMVITMIPGQAFAQAAGGEPAPDTGAVANPNAMTLAYGDKQTKNFDGTDLGAVGTFMKDNTIKEATLKLNEDIPEFGTSLIVPSGSKFTLDLNGHNLKTEKNSVNIKGKNDGTKITITDHTTGTKGTLSTIDKANVDLGEKGNGKETLSEKNALVINNGVTLSGSVKVHYGDVTINNAHLGGGVETQIYTSDTHPNVVLKDSSFGKNLKNDTATFIVYKGVLSVTNCTVESPTYIFDAGQGTKADIYSGTYNTDDAVVYDWSSDMATIHGGTFKTPHADDFDSSFGWMTFKVPAGKVMTYNAVKDYWELTNVPVVDEGKLEVTPDGGEPVEYNKVADAFAAAVEGGTIKLLADSKLTGNEGIEEIYSYIELDLNGFTLTLSPAVNTPTAGAISVGRGNLVIKDSSQAQTGKLDLSGADYGITLVRPQTKLNLEGGTVIGSKKATICRDSEALAQKHYVGNINIKGGNISQNDGKAILFSADYNELLNSELGNGKINISGGKINATLNAQCVNATGCVDVNITGDAELSADAFIPVFVQGRNVNLNVNGNAKVLSKNTNTTLMISAGPKAVIGGNAYISNAGKFNAINVQMGTIEINDSAKIECTTGESCIYNQWGTVNINGGLYKMADGKFFYRAMKDMPSEGAYSKLVYAKDTSYKGDKPNVGFYILNSNKDKEGYYNLVKRQDINLKNSLNQNVGYQNFEKLDYALKAADSTLKAENSENPYTNETKEILEKVKADAELLVKNTNANQYEIEIVTNNLNNAITGLKTQRESDPNKLVDGTYEVTVAALQHGTNNASMTSGAMDSKAKVIVKDGKADLHLTFHPTVVMGFNGHLVRLWLYDGNSAAENQLNSKNGTNLLRCKAIKYYTVSESNPLLPNIIEQEGSNAEWDNESVTKPTHFPYELVMPLKYRGTENGDDRYVGRVSVDQMNIGNIGEQDVDFVIKWSTLKATENVKPVLNVDLDKIDLVKAGTKKVTPEVWGDTGYEFTWKSNNTDVATVDNGTITAVAAGTTTITVTATKGESVLTKDITVNVAADDKTAINANASAPTEAGKVVATVEGNFMVSNGDKVDNAKNSVLIDATVVSEKKITETEVAINIDTAAVLADLNKPLEIKTNVGIIKVDAALADKIKAENKVVKLSIAKINEPTSKPEGTFAAWYDLNLKSEDGSSVAFGNGNATVTVPKVEGTNYAYHIEKDAIKEKLPVHIAGENMSWTTTHFSTWALSAKDYNLTPVKPDPTPEPEGPSYFLEDGNYYVDVALWHEIHDRASMGNIAFADYPKALVTVSNGTVTNVEIATNQVDVASEEDANSTIHSALTGLEVIGSTVSVLETGDLITIPANNKHKYIKRASFNMPSDAIPSFSNENTYAVVKVTVPDTPMDDVFKGGVMDARLKFTWNTATKTSDTHITMKPDVVDPENPGEPEVKPDPDKPVDPEVKPDPEQPEVDPVRPAKVENLKIRTDYGLLKVTFDKSKEDVELYRIAVRKHGDKAWKYYETKNNSLIIKKLNGKALVKSAKYDVMVAAVRDKAENIRSYYTKVKTVYANKSGVKAYKMYSPKFESIKRYNSGKTKVVVRNVKYTGETYQVAFRVKGTKTWKNTHYSTRTVRYITGLKKGKTYQFKVNYRYKSKLDGKTYVYSNSVYKYAKIR